jgi:hypothetical protein
MFFLRDLSYIGCLYLYLHMVAMEFESMSDSKTDRDKTVLVVEPESELICHRLGLHHCGPL